MKREKVSEKDLELSLDSACHVNVIEVIPREVITNHKKVYFDGKNFDQPEVLQISVLERYGKGCPPANGLVMGFGPLNGAFASSVAHDCHNIIVIGSDPKAMALAANALIEKGGGFSVATNNKLLGIQPLPIAGLMCEETSDVIAKNLETLHHHLKDLGVKVKNPFLQMAFLSLPVIPSLKITDQGLYDGIKHEFIELKFD